MSILFSVVLLAFWVYDLYAKYNGHKRYTKPVLLPCIILLYVCLSFCFDRRVHVLEIAALFLGWAGDVLLLTKKDSFLLAGLVSFLSGHMMYLILFFSLYLPSFSYTTLCAVILYGIYGWILYKRIVVHVPHKFKIPVIVYLFVILSMSCAAGLLHHGVSLLSWILIWGGSLLFVASDTLVAIEKFMNPDIHGVMELYVPAQVLLMAGVLII